MEENNILLHSLQSQLENLNRAPPGALKEKRKQHLAMELEETKRMIRELESTKSKIEQQLDTLFIQASLPRRKLK
jgi:signal transduction histidine kinase